MTVVPDDIELAEIAELEDDDEEFAPRFLTFQTVGLDEYATKLLFK
jgi:hypothetical protein